MQEIVWPWAYHQDTATPPAASISASTGCWPLHSTTWTRTPQGRSRQRPLGCLLLGLAHSGLTRNQHTLACHDKIHTLSPAQSSSNLEQYPCSFCKEFLAFCKSDQRKLTRAIFTHISTAAIMFEAITHCAQHVLNTLPDIANWTVQALTACSHCKQHVSGNSTCNANPEMPEQRGNTP